MNLGQFHLKPSEISTEFDRTPNEWLYIKSASERKRDLEPMFFFGTNLV